ncbi:MAG: GYD domain-containing protein [SAR202 cluster bacterium]|nr:GYD domain-containing protein [SAR202 cluster bacterium]
MAMYIMLSKLTDDGRKTIKQRPDRIKEVNKEIEAFGAKVIDQYATLGPYDFVNILEAPDNETITKISVELGSRGSVELMSMPAMKADAFINMLKTAEKMSHGSR